MSTHFNTSGPTPTLRRIHPFAASLVLSLTQIAVPPDPKNALVFGGSVSVASNAYDESFGNMRAFKVHEPSVSTFRTSLLSRVTPTLT